MDTYIFGRYYWIQRHTIKVSTSTGLHRRAYMDMCGVVEDFFYLNENLLDLVAMEVCCNPAFNCTCTTIKYEQIKYTCQFFC